MGAGVADQGARHDALEVRARERILADEQRRQKVAHGRDQPAERIARHGRREPRRSHRAAFASWTSTFSAVAIVTLDMVICALSCSATGIASTRRMISGLCSCSARALCVLVSMLRS
jgi:hypothetical protein